MKYIRFKARVRGIHKYLIYARITITVQVDLYYPFLKKNNKIHLFQFRRDWLTEGQYSELYTKRFERTSTWFCSVTVLFRGTLWVIRLTPRPDHGRHWSRSVWWGRSVWLCLVEAWKPPGDGVSSDSQGSLFPGCTTLLAGILFPNVQAQHSSFCRCPLLHLLLPLFGSGVIVAPRHEVIGCCSTALASSSSDYTSTALHPLLSGPMH